MINKVIIVGRLGRDPELRYTGSGTAVSSFSVATDDSWTDKSGDRQTRTEWHNVVAWSRLAEICGQYLNKGKLVYIEGRLQTREWEDRDGNRRWTTEIVASEMKMLSGPRDQDSDRMSGPAPSPPVGNEQKPSEQKPSEQKPSEQKPNEGSGGMEVGITDDDIPF